MRQEFYRRAYRALKPTWVDSLTLYRETILSIATSASEILDLGCGHADWLGPVYARARGVYGLDPDLAALYKNTTLENVLVGKAEQLPFAAGSFDLIIAAWVLEHLRHPSVVLREFHRVLRPGGSLVFLTPNAWNYNTWPIRAIPNVFHKPLVRMLYGREEADTYPAHYRLNSPRVLDRTFATHGFWRTRLILNGDPTYISFNDTLFKLACLVERLLELGPLAQTRVHLIGIYSKVPGAGLAGPL